MVRKAAVLDALEREADAIANAPFDIGHIAVGCALSYLDFRYADEDWRKDHPRIARWHATFDARPSVRAALPIDDS
jgi:glutathione S-transferase